MSAWLSKSTTLSLAVFYALLVSFGHALHSHGDCCDSNGETAEVICPCGHHHEPAGNTESGDSDSSGWRSMVDNDGCQDCAACQLLSHLKVGHHAIQQYSAASTYCDDWAVVYQSPFCSPTHEAWAPRGPPLGLSA